jgi:pyruvate/2-oxoglutarate dehydrogenase complex dihydrolipoamide acyltransferase (E2) component
MITLIQVPLYVALLKNYSSKPTITRWMKQDGDVVEEHEGIVLIETSKASLEVPSPGAGMIFILRNARDKVKIGDTVGVIAKNKSEFTAFKKCLAAHPMR